MTSYVLWVYSVHSENLDMAPRNTPPLYQPVLDDFSLQRRLVAVWRILNVMGLSCLWITCMFYLTFELAAGCIWCLLTCEWGGSGSEWGARWQPVPGKYDHTISHHKWLSNSSLMTPRLYSFLQIPCCLWIQDTILYFSQVLLIFCLQQPIISRNYHVGVKLCYHCAYRCN